MNRLLIISGLSLFSVSLGTLVFLMLFSALT